MSLRPPPKLAYFHLFLPFGGLFLHARQRGEFEWGGGENLNPEGEFWTEHCIKHSGCLCTADQFVQRSQIDNKLELNAGKQSTDFFYAWQLRLIFSHVIDSRRPHRASRLQCIITSSRSSPGRQRNVTFPVRLRRPRDRRVSLTMSPPPPPLSFCD